MMENTYESYKKRTQNSNLPSNTVLSLEAFSEALTEQSTVLNTQGDPIAVTEHITPFINTEFFKQRGVTRLGALSTLSCTNEEIDSLLKSHFDYIVVPCHKESLLHSSRIEADFRRYGKELLTITVQNNEPATVTHGKVIFSGDIPLMTEQEVIERYPGIEVTHESLLSEQDMHQFDKIYRPVFEGLSARHPIIGDLSKDEVESLMLTPENTTVVLRTNNGIEAVAVLCAVTDIPWLNKEYFENTNKSPRLYCPIVVSAGKSHTKPMNSAVSLLTDGYHFECPNETIGYVSQKVTQKTAPERTAVTTLYGVIEYKLLSTRH